MDNLIIVIPCITLLVLFYMYSSKSQEGITTMNSYEDDIKESSTSEEDNEPFIPSESFIGEKSGYVFKNDNEGLGYYKDNTIIED
jgi:hypothetical protein